MIVDTDRVAWWHVVAGEGGEVLRLILEILICLVAAWRVGSGHQVDGKGHYSHKADHN